MNSYHKYLKYKNKYLTLKQDIYNQYGGAPIKIDITNSRIIQIKTNEELAQYKDKLIELTKVCEPNDSFNPSLVENFDIFWVLVHNSGDIVGYLKSQDLQQFEDNEYFELLGGIKGKKGLQIGGACNGMPEKYSNLATPLLNDIEKYAKENNYDYIVLHAGTDREYLIGEGERPGLYIKNGYKKARILKAGDGGFSDIDLWILYKFIK
jgi:hypothetical protein